MRKSIRLLVLACASMLVLAFAGTAAAAFKPSFIVDQTSYKPGAATRVGVLVEVAATDDPTAKITLYAPLGYTATLSQAPGTPLGAVIAVVRARALADARLTLTGLVTVAAAGTFTTEATLCTGTPVHQAIWQLNLSAPGRTIPVPVFVDTIVGGPEAAFAAVKIQVCFRPPDVPENQGGAPLGNQLVSAFFDTVGVFANPVRRDIHRWQGLFTPYLPGGKANPAGTVEARAYVPIPFLLTMARQKTKGSAVKLGGSLIAAGQPITGVRLDLYSGTKASAVNKRVARTTKTSAKGKYSVTRPAVKKTTFFQATFPGAQVAGGCQAPSLAPLGCVSAALSPIDSNIVRVKPPAKKKKKR